MGSVYNMVQLCVCLLNMKGKRFRRLRRKDRERQRERGTSICLCQNRWYHRAVKCGIFFKMKALVAVAIIYHTQMERELRELQVNCNCRCHAEKDTRQRKTQRQFHRHLTRTKDIMALKAKRLNETGKSVFLGIHLHSNYSDILGRARRHTYIQCTVARRTSFGTLIRAVTRKRPYY